MTDVRIAEVGDTHVFSKSMATLCYGLTGVNYSAIESETNIVFRRRQKASIDDVSDARHTGRII